MRPLTKEELDLERKGDNPFHMYEKKVTGGVGVSIEKAA